VKALYWFDWLDLRAKPKPWLIVGKGPTFARADEVDWDKYNVLSLNHAMTVAPTFVGHAYDIEVIDQLGESLLKVPVVVMPWLPNESCKPSKITLDQRLKGRPHLTEMAKTKRLMFYDSSTAPVKLRRGRYRSVVRVRFFSAVAAVNLLAVSGVKQIFTLGVDGGSSYAPNFDKKTLLVNGRTSFDIQFKEIRQTEKNKGVTVTPLFAPGGTPCTRSPSSPSSSPRTSPSSG
jgi:hypothetical protein